MSKYFKATSDPFYTGSPISIKVDELGNQDCFLGWTLYIYMEMKQLISSQRVVSEAEKLLQQKYILTSSYQISREWMTKSMVSDELWWD